MKDLNCKIVESFGNNLTYVVFDGDNIIASGVSSDESWVKHDAGGYHTKNRFDKLYPEGWKVHFNF